MPAGAGAIAASSTCTVSFASAWTLRRAPVFPRAPRESGPPIVHQFQLVRRVV